jgi:hypothetical protein
VLNSFLTIAALVATVNAIMFSVNILQVATVQLLQLLLLLLLIHACASTAMLCTIVLPFVQKIGSNLAVKLLLPGPYRYVLQICIVLISPSTAALSVRVTPVHPKHSYCVLY